MMATSWPGSKCPEQGSRIVFCSPPGSVAEKPKSLKVKLAAWTALLDFSMASPAAGGCLIRWLVFCRAGGNISELVEPTLTTDAIDLERTWVGFR
jgi:hypothetical protein